MAPKNKKLWHPYWEKCHNTWKEHFPESEYQHVFWDDAKIDEFIENEFPDYITYYYSLPFHIMQLDFARYCIIYKYGGIYVDMDYYCLKNFYSELNKNIFFVESSYPKEIIQNSLFGSVKNNKHILNIINESKKIYYYYEIINDSYDKNFNDYVLTLSGPILISNYYKNLSDKNKKYLQVLEKDKFNPNIVIGNIEDINGGNYNCFHVLTGSWGKDMRKLRMQEASLDNVNYNELLKTRYKNLRPLAYEKFNDFLSSV